MVLIPGPTHVLIHSIPANMVLTPLPIDSYSLHVFLPQRCCERTSTTTASCESISFPLLVSLTHVSFAQHKTFRLGHVVVRSSSLITLCAVNRIGGGSGGGGGGGRRGLLVKA